MQNLYDEVGTLDRRCYEEFFLSEDLLMEHAAEGMARYIRNALPKNSRILIAAGSGNNGADGIALARLLHGDYQVDLITIKEPKSAMAKLQTKRTEAIGLKAQKELHPPYDAVVDAVLGTGFRGVFNEHLRGWMERLNALDALKIACDIPSGVQKEGNCEAHTFQADVTLTMGALKKSLYHDEAKAFTGRIHVLDLGVARSLYETKTPWKLLDEEDLRLPYRNNPNTHKGSYGHTAVIAGEKSGAALLSAGAALRIGSGLVTIVDCQNITVPMDLMHSEHLPENTTAIAVGMGLGNIWQEAELDELFLHDAAYVVDADLFYNEKILRLLQKQNVVLTPHPKEFAALLRQAGIADVDTKEVQEKRFYYAELFSRHFPSAVLMLKGANVIIAAGGEFFINPHGSAKLAKGGSGDVLAGVTAGLLAQGYTPLDAACNASLIHTKLAKLYDGADFSLTPSALLETISKL